MLQGLLVELPQRCGLEWRAGEPQLVLRELPAVVACLASVCTWPEGLVLHCDGLPRGLTHKGHIYRLFYKEDNAKGVSLTLALAGDPLDRLDCPVALGREVSGLGLLLPPVEPVGGSFDPFSPETGVADLLAGFIVVCAPDLRGWLTSWLFPPRLSDNPLHLLVRDRAVAQTLIQGA